MVCALGHGNQRDPSSREPFSSRASSLAQSSGDAREVRTPLPEHFAGQNRRAQACPTVQTMLGTGLSVTGGNGPLSLESVGKEPQCRENRVQESHAVSCTEGSRSCLSWRSRCPA